MVTIAHSVLLAVADYQDGRSNRQPVANFPIPRAKPGDLPALDPLEPIVASRLQWPARNFARPAQGIHTTARRAIL